MLTLQQYTFLGRYLDKFPLVPEIWQVPTAGDKIADMKAKKVSNAVFKDRGRTNTRKKAEEHVHVYITMAFSQICKSAASPATALFSSSSGNSFNQKAILHSLQTHLYPSSQTQPPRHSDAMFQLATIMAPFVMRGIRSDKQFERQTAISNLAWCHRMRSSEKESLRSFASDFFELFDRARALLSDQEEIDEVLRQVEAMSAGENKQSGSVTDELVRQMEAISVAAEKQPGSVTDCDMDDLCAALKSDI
ncbi:hypothetical protein LIA77_11015 [Sarocladium implicatum]|nr:hypothetical protein LIA77_11015 [Sarocladium implicatum]